MAQYLWRFPFSGERRGNDLRRFDNPGCPRRPRFPVRTPLAAAGVNSAENFLPIPAQIRGLAERIIVATAACIFRQRGIIDGATVEVELPPDNKLRAGRFNWKRPGTMPQAGRDSELVLPDGSAVRIAVTRVGGGSVDFITIGEDSQTP
jgi:hypothetical protein